MMTRVVVLTAAVFLAGGVFLHAQDPKEEPRPQPQQEEPNQDRDMNQPRQEEPKAPEKEKQPKASQDKSAKDQSKENKDNKGQEAPQSQARPAGKGAHIPDQKFKASFGRQHTFAVKQVINTTTVTAGQTQFIYGGYTFVILDPWPSAWLFTDNCYIDYVDDEYFLFDLLHPGIRIALIVQG